MEIAIKAALAAADNDDPFIVVEMDSVGEMMSSHRGTAQQVKKMLDHLHDAIL